ncbi:hypothetical protein PPL_07395 [Heterostelium album PN500]|uniref:SIS domain-containing protein n=1 Tax=Heterostelium pallidum (strain ATCC 26659 / Pp 5 / PN500) TaxID=670386 RepID=D3BFU4_HETP5|nr:hypothetical protein PPL_07395 [Heterostelium album PN500]EFA79704.1 hypothetical protein PPL_07395 [Heterostelium album PN500]|eukprot:XP_020431825.1 hypothetical protein PPL_07395 [Heterostelium album PN500]
MNKQSITETPNELTGELDSLSSIEMLRLFRQTDAQIFSGYKEYPGINDTLIIDHMVELIHCIQSLTVSREVDFVVSGAGTSGRLAYFLARSFAKWTSLPNARYHYLIAGGDRALTVGVEGAEDDIEQARADINSIMRPNAIVVYFGVTCGLSAPYVASQIARLLDCKSDHIINVVGFNPLERARTNIIEKWDKSFADVINQLDFKSGKHFLVNPIVGPEPLTGSTRMKSGTATKILLEIILSLGLKGVMERTDIKSMIYQRLSQYEMVYRATYRCVEGVARIVDDAGSSLSNHGHLYYLGSKSLGIVGFIDASETVPTFGAGHLDVRGFIMDDEEKQGWMVMDNKDGDQAHLCEQYRISQSHFISMIPSMESNDTVVISISSDDSIELYQPILDSLSAKNDKRPRVNIIYFNHESNSINNNNCINISGSINNNNNNNQNNNNNNNNNNNSSNNNCHSNGNSQVNSLKNSSCVGSGLSMLNLSQNVYTLTVTLPFKTIDRVPSFYELSLKWILNALTTGGFVLAGKVYGNRMIDLGLTNNKLFHRSCGIIEKLFGVSALEARDSLLRSIYSLEKNDQIPEAVSTAPIYQHIDYANQNTITHIIPVALLMASGRFDSPLKARETIKNTPVIRKLLQQHQNNNNIQPSLYSN